MASKVQKREILLKSMPTENSKEKQQNTNAPSLFDYATIADRLSFELLQRPTGEVNLFYEATFPATQLFCNQLDTH